MKQYKYCISKYFIKYDSSIRSRNDIVMLLLHIVKFLLQVNVCDDFESTKDVELIIKVDKMSRIFICTEEKIHTFHFPFELKTISNKFQICYQGEIIDNLHIAVLMSLFYEVNIISDINQLYELFLDIEKINQLSKEDFRLCSKLITLLLSFEIGYLRYDYDERYNNGDIHPLNHLDINFTNGSTFKLGLKEKINQTVLDDIVDTGTNCHYLVKS